MRLWSLLYAGFARNNASLFDMTLDAGAELRMPLYDQRVVNFAWSRPPQELNNGLEYKVILCDSMKGVLPAAVLAARDRRTGTSDGYFRRMAKREMTTFAQPLLMRPVLAELGIIDPVLLKTDTDGWISAAQMPQLHIVIACSVESWLRARI